MQDMPLLRQSHLYDVWPTDQPGEWVDCSTELDAKTVLEFRATARDCYCYQGVNRCDFCTGLRKPDRNSNEFGSIEAAQVALMSRGYQSENNSTHRFCKGDEWAAIYGGGSNAGLPTIYVVNTGTYN